MIIFILYLIISIIFSFILAFLNGKSSEIPTIGYIIGGIGWPFFIIAEIYSKIEEFGEVQKNKLDKN